MMKKLATQTSRRDAANPRRPSRKAHIEDVQRIKERRQNGPSYVHPVVLDHPILQGAWPAYIGGDGCDGCLSCLLVL